MSNGLSGKASLAYQGTNAPTPPNLFFYPRAPTPQNYQNFEVGDFWVYRVSPVSNNNQLWVLMGKAANIANWVLLSGSVGPVLGLMTDDGNLVTPTLGVINIHGGMGITTTGTVGPNTVTISASGSVAESFPTDQGTAVPIAGVLNIKTLVSVLNSGATIKFAASTNNVVLQVTDVINNTIIGNLSGNVTTTGTDNTGYGGQVLTALSSGSNNTSVGFLSSHSITTASNNTVIGEGAAFSLTTGNSNIALGVATGTGWLSSESGNICIGSVGGVGDSNLLRIGDGTGVGANQLQGAFISGIDGVNVGSTAKVVTMGTGGTANVLGTAVITAGTGIAVTPGANTITITNTGTGGANQFPTDAGTANQASGVLNILGGNGITTSGAGNTVTVSEAAIPSFSAILSANQANVTGDGTTYTIVYDSVSFDTLGNYNNATGIFTAPYNGIYYFSGWVGPNTFTNAHTGGYVALSINGGGGAFGFSSNPYATQATVGTPPNAVFWNTNALFSLNAGDTVNVVVRIEGGARTVGVLMDQAFAGYLVRRT